MSSPDIVKRLKRESKIAKYREEREILTAELNTLNNRRKRISSRLKNISVAIYDLLHESKEVPSVTDHAIVRYLERFKGLDVNQLKVEVANHKYAQLVDNIVVTVNEPTLEEMEQS